MSLNFRAFFAPLALLFVLAAFPAWGQTATAGQLIISEFRVRGPNGANDEFIEIYNASGADHTVAAASGSGYGVAASDGTTRCSLPNGTVIPSKGHYLCVNSVGYSLASYPAGNGTTATGDATYTTDIPDNAGIALFNNNTGGGSYSLANRLDAVGSTSEANTLYKEGTGYPALVPFSIDSSFYRDTCGKGGSITTSGNCSLSGDPKDTNNNAADFVFVDTNGTSAGAGQRLGAPGPENLSSPLNNSSIGVGLLDSCVGDFNPPNFVRDLTSDPANNSTFGTVDIRRTFINNTGGNVTRLRYRVIDLTTFPAPSGFADLRPRTSTAVVVTVDRPPCGTGTSNVTVQGTTLEQPASQPNGGGFNSSLSSGTVTLATPLANGASLDVRFLLGVQQTGTFRLGIEIEGLPSGGGADTFVLECDTNGACSPTVSSVSRNDPNPTEAASVDYTVVFSQNVTGVDVTDFALTTTGGISGASVTSVAGSGSTYTVTVDTGAGDGTIRLDVVDDDTIVNGSALPLGGSGAGNGDFTSGEVYSLNHVVCGDGVPEGAEECDNGGSNSDVTPDACRTDCTNAGCGDGVIDTGETCDDGNTLAGDGCSDICQTDGGTTGGTTGGTAGGTTGGTTGGAPAGSENELACSNPGLSFLDLIEGLPVEVFAPDSNCGGPSALTLKSILHASCVCAWRVTPEERGAFLNAANCDATFVPGPAGTGLMEVDVDCGAGPLSTGSYAQSLVVHPRATASGSGGGCSLIR